MGEVVVLVDCGFARFCVVAMRKKVILHCFMNL